MSLVTEEVAEARERPREGLLDLEKYRTMAGGDLVLGVWR